jgi:hypothetical protein
LLQVVLPFSAAMFLPQISQATSILDGHGKILDLVALNHPLEILHGGVAQILVQNPCELCTLSLSLRETFLVFRNNVDESKMIFVPWIVIVLSTLVHTKFHIRISLRLPVYKKNLIVTIICDAILLNQISQSDDVGDCCCATPNILVVARHSGFPSHYHSTTVAFQSHACGGFVGLSYQGCITEKIHSGLAIQ